MSVLQDIKSIWGQKQQKHELIELDIPTKTILIVGRDPIFLKKCKNTFTSEGYTVLTAEDGKKGLEVTLTSKPDIILLELMTPAMDGKSMIRKLRQFPQFNRLPILVLTDTAGVKDNKVTMRYDDACEFMIKEKTTINEIVEKADFWLNTLQ